MHGGRKSKFTCVFPIRSSLSICKANRRCNELREKCGEQFMALQESIELVGAIYYKKTTPPIGGAAVVDC